MEFLVVVENMAHGVDKIFIAEAWDFLHNSDTIRNFLLEYFVQ